MAMGKPRCPECEGVNEHADTCQRGDSHPPPAPFAKGDKPTIWTEPGEFSVIPGFIMKRPIPFVITEEDDTYIASWTETAIYGWGKHHFEAMECLMGSISETWNDLHDAAEKLGRNMLHLREVMEAYLENDPEREFDLHNFEHDD